MSGAPAAQVIRRVTLPLLLPGLISAGTLLLIAATLSLDIPLIIGLPANQSLLSLQIYRTMQPVSGVPAYGDVAATNNVLFVGLALAMLVYHRATRQAERFAIVSGKAYRPVRMRLGSLRGPLFSIACLYFVAALALPFLALVWVTLVPFFSGFDPSMLTRLSLQNFVDVFTSDRVRASAGHSLVVASMAAIGVCLVALLVSWIVVRSRVRWRRLLDALAMLPIGTSALMMGIALVFIFFGFRAIPIYGTVWIIIIGHVIVYLPFSTRTIQAAMLQLNRELEEAAQVAGASMLRAFRRIMAPLLAPALVGVLIWVSLHSLREFSVAVMLQSGRNEVLSTVLYSYWNSGKAQYATAIAVSLMVFLGALVLLTGRLTSRRVEG
jgi:iron(III) transport system permease protein